ncbi:DUF3667 domain-containing protein [Pedomonas sp. V897]|uniref:DUF3667 domain-containing protein n=1 Tax=Pedomonas sp. V897 TaxID=3446482 RepID=UPI003EE01831
MSHEEPSATCRNCAATLTGPYCAACGQKAEHLHRPFWEIAEDFLHSVVHFDGRLWRTLRSLFLHPGEMTADWADGRQARYVPPIRLFIFTSLILVITLSLSDVALLRLVRQDGGPVATSSARGEVNIPNLSLEVLSIAPDTSTDPAMDKGIIDFASDDEVSKEFASSFVTGINALARNPRLSNEMIGKSLSRFMLMAVPVMAVLLWLMYLRRKRYLAEHLVFALNIHTFFFIGLLLAVVLVWVSRGLVPGGWLLFALWIGFSLHFLIALKRMYQQGWIKTFIKSAIITGAYFFALMAIGIGLLVNALQS